MRACSNCTHNMTCYARIQLVRLTQTFKLLAMTRKEMEEMECEATVDTLFSTLAGCCSKYKPDDPPMFEER